MNNSINLNSKLGAMAAHAARTMPSDDEISRRAATKYLESKKDPNQFENWFHAVKDNDIRHPKTKLIPFPLEASIAISKEDEHTFLSNPELTVVENSIKDAFTEFGRDELFLKNSLYSGKHSWARTCHIKHDSNIRHHLGQITYEWLMNSPVYATHMVVRELIPTAPAFYAFGGTPIVQEFRLFAKDGKTYAYQAYWPQDSILDPNCDDWASKLKSISKATQIQLDEMIAGANKVTKTLGGDWSIDFLIDKDGKPWLIDMALSSQSYISPERVSIN